MMDEPDRFLSPERHFEATQKQLASTPQTIAALRGFGVTPEMQLKLEYFFYSNALDKGRALATALLALGYSAEAKAAAHDPSLCVVTGWTTPLAIDEAPLVAWTKAMCEMGFEKDCEFDGWGTPVPQRAPSPAPTGTKIKYEKVPPMEALKVLDVHRRAFGESKLFPFIVGNDDDVARFKEMINPPADGGAAFIEASRSVDVAAWFAGHKLPPDGRWPKDFDPGKPATQSLYDVLTGKLKNEINIGFVRCENSWEAFAALGYGGWNECPDPHIHVAIQAYWRERYASSPIAISDSVVGRPPDARDAALALAREQYAYCPDIVDQGTEKISMLGATLVKSPRWYFWWD